MGVAWALLVSLAVVLVVAIGGRSAAAAAPRGAAGSPHAHATHATPRRVRHRRMPFSRLRPARAKLRRQGLKQPTLTLKSSFIRRASAAGVVLPFTIRLRKPYEGGPGDDVLSMSWDTGVVPWPLDGTQPPSAPSTTHLDGAATYEWDYGADTTGYSELGTVETILGGGISMTGDGFPIAQQAGATCTSAQALDATGMALTSAGARFGIINPFSGEVTGTINLRTDIRTQITPCDGTTPVTADAGTTSDDPPLPVAFTGHFTVSPGLSSDGRLRLGILTVDDAVIPQRTTFGLIHACTDPSAPDGCASKAFPVRTKLLSLTAEVLAGDVLPPPPTIPGTSTGTPASTATPSSTGTPTSTAAGVPMPSIVR